MSARRSLLRLPLTGNHRRLRSQWCNERWTWTTEWNDIVFTDESCFYLQHHDDTRKPRLPVNRCELYYTSFTFYNATNLRPTVTSHVQVLWFITNLPAFQVLLRDSSTRYREAPSCYLAFVLQPKPSDSPGAEQPPSRLVFL
ncbi:hypothetical protein TNCV_3982762 [Trichonephila clavipes]|nr:hypothetical protein TNCV_3982762 [Trichonephila clavipes]